MFFNSKTKTTFRRSTSCFSFINIWNDTLLTERGNSNIRSWVKFLALETLLTKVIEKSRQHWLFAELKFRFFQNYPLNLFHQTGNRKTLTCKPLINYQALTLIPCSEHLTSRNCQKCTRAPFVSLFKLVFLQLSARFLPPRSHKTF